MLPNVESVRKLRGRDAVGARSIETQSHGDRRVRIRVARSILANVCGECFGPVD